MTVSCTSTRIDFFEQDKRVIYKINIPHGYKKQVDADYHGKKAFYFTYNNGSILYFTNGGTGLVMEAKSAKYGKYIYDTMYISDSINIKGRYKNLFWRESKKDNIVSGFLNVDSLSIANFNEIIDKQEFKK